MDCGTYSTENAGVMHPPYTKTPPETAKTGPFFWRKSENGAFSAKTGVMTQRLG